MRMGNEVALMNGNIQVATVHLHRHGARIRCTRRRWVLAPVPCAVLRCPVTSVPNRWWEATCLSSEPIPPARLSATATDTQMLQIARIIYPTTTSPSPAVSPAAYHTGQLVSLFLSLSLSLSPSLSLSLSNWPRVYCTLYCCSRQLLTSTGTFSHYHIFDIP